MADTGPGSDRGAGATPGLTPVQWLETPGLWVKRDDLFVAGGISGGKVRTCLALAQQQPAGALVTAGGRHSPQVSIVARVGRLLGRPVRCHVPAGQPGPTLLDAEAAGASLVPHRPGYNSVLVARAREDAKASGACLIPFGMECDEAVTQTAGQVANVPADVRRVVVPVGSGMSLAGCLAGRVAQDMHWPVLGVVVGAAPEARLDRYAPGWRWDGSVQLNWASQKYSQPATATDLAGISLDPYYEAKCLPYLRPGDLLWIVGRRAA